MNCWYLETCSAHDIIDDLGEELDLVYRAPQTPWKATLQPLAYEKLRLGGYLYEAHGHEWIKVYENYRIPFVIHMRFAGFDSALPTTRPLGLGCRRGVDEQNHPRVNKPSWNDFVWELATRYAEPWNPHGPQVIDVDAYRSMPVDHLYSFYEGRWLRFDPEVSAVRERVMLTLLELEQEGKLQIESSDHPDGNYKILHPMLLQNRAWTEW
jgi:hypothetical protein